MINGLLHVTTIEADAVRVEYTEINLYKLLEELRANYDLRGVTVYVRHVPEADMFELKVRIPEQEFPKKSFRPSWICSKRWTALLPRGMAVLGWGFTL